LLFYKNTQLGIFYSNLFNTNANSSPIDENLLKIILDLRTKALASNPNFTIDTLLNNEIMIENAVIQKILEQH